MSVAETAPNKRDRSVSIIGLFLFWRTIAA
jgi:hypothetical protein